MRVKVLVELDTDGVVTKKDLESYMSKVLNEHWVVLGVELQKNEYVPIEQRSRRAVVMIDEVEDGLEHSWITFCCPRWNQDVVLIRDTSWFPKHVKPYLRKGMFLTANINTEAKKEEDLYFKDWRVIGEDYD